MVVMAHLGNSVRIVGPRIETFGQNRLLAVLSDAVANPWQDWRPGWVGERPRLIFTAATKWPKNGRHVRILYCRHHQLKDEGEFV